MILKGKINSSEAEKLADYISGQEINIEVVVEGEKEQLLIQHAESPGLLYRFDLKVSG